MSPMAYPLLLLLLLIGNPAEAQDLRFPDPEKSTPDELAAHLPPFVAAVWASSDLAAVLSTTAPTADDVGAALDVWSGTRLAVPPGETLRLLRVADISLPLAQRLRITKPTEPFYDQRSYADAWWRCATMDWFSAGFAGKLSAVDIDALVLGQLDGSAPVRLHPEDEHLLLLAAATSGASGAVVRNFLSQAHGWMASQLFNDLVIALWRTHPDARPATGEAWGDLYLAGSVERLLVMRAMGEVYADRHDPLFVAFLRTGMKRFPDGIAGFIGGSLYQATPELPAAVGAEEACAWLTQMARSPEWNPETTIESLHYWVLGSPVYANQDEPGDVLTIGRLAESIRVLQREALRASTATGGASASQAQFNARLDVYEQRWREQPKP